LKRHTASPDGRKPPTKRITIRGTILMTTVKTMTPTTGPRTIERPPEIGQPCFPKTINPQKGTCLSPKGRRRQSPKRQNLFSENKKPPKRDMPRAPIAPKTVPKTPKPFFRKQETPKKGHAAPGKPPFWYRPQTKGFNGGACPLTNMVSRNDRQKSSANHLVPRVFAQKGFAISIFGHFFCPFSENFIESCRVKIKNNKIIPQDLL
jgi:hypothetical protein